MLDGIRVLDLTDERGNVAAMILGGLGAEVIAVEPEGGNPARRLAPFVADTANPDGSLVHWAYNRGKQSVVVPLTDPRFADLVRSADVLFETGELAAAGLSAADLAAVNPALVHVAITAFGLDWSEGVVAGTGPGGAVRCGAAAPVRGRRPVTGAVLGAAGLVPHLRRRGRRGDVGAGRTAAVRARAVL